MLESNPRTRTGVGSFTPENCSVRLHALFPSLTLARIVGNGLPLWTSADATNHERFLAAGLQERLLAL